MQRRAFFGALAGLVSTAALDPERLLWVPGKKLISIPKPSKPLFPLHEWVHVEEHYDGETRKVFYNGDLVLTELCAKPPFVIWKPSEDLWGTSFAPSPSDLPLVHSYQLAQR